MAPLDAPADSFLQLAEAYDYDEAFWTPIVKRLHEKVAALDPGPGNASENILNHLQRVYTNALGFLKTKTASRPAYSDIVAKNMAIAMLIHDVAKCMDHPHEWRVTLEKPDKSHLTAEEKAARKIRREIHAERGPQLLTDTIKELGLNPQLHHQALIKLCSLIMKYHHENPDGSGPQKLTAAELFPLKLLSIARIIDAFDGKQKNGKSPEQNILEMANNLQYDRSTVLEYGQYLGILPAPTPVGVAKPVVS